MVLKGINRAAWGTMQTAPLGLLCGLYWFVPHPEGTALLFEPEWLLLPPFSLRPTLAFPLLPPARPPPIDSIRDTAGTVKNHLKNQQHSSTLLVELAIN